MLTVPDSARADPATPTPVGQTCEVWIGSSESNELDSSRLDDLDEEALLKRDGIGIVYIPLGPNEARVPGFDPFVISTWRREVTAEESQALLDVSEVSRYSIVLLCTSIGHLHIYRPIFRTVARK